MSRAATARKWKPDYPVLDAPFIEGKRCRISEVPAVPFDSNPRRQFVVWVDEERATVLWIDGVLREMLICSAHVEECDHKVVTRRFMEADK